MIIKATDLVKHVQGMINVYGEDLNVVLHDGKAYRQIEDLEDVLDSEDEDSACDAFFGGKTFLAILVGNYL